jgi:hypothetical protein
MMGKWEYMSVVHCFIRKKGIYHPVDLWEDKSRSGLSTMDILSEKGNEGWEIISAEIIYTRSRDIDPVSEPAIIYTLKRQKD